jgi:hypothetical protein
MRPTAFMAAALVIGAKQLEVLMHVGRIAKSDQITVLDLNTNTVCGNFHCKITPF